MKTSIKAALLSLAAIACSLVSMGTAYAQSNVTLYGLIDESLNYVSNEGGHSAFTQTSGNVQGSRWGIKGTEDLGGGYQAIFTLENGFALNNGAFGQGGLEFGRQAFVGLTTPAGTITLGRQYDFLIYLYSMTNLFNAGTYGFHLGDYDRLGGERLNNVIAYQTPTFDGLKVGVLYAPGGQPGHLAAGSAQSYGISYSSDNLNLAAAYTSVNNTTITPAATIGVPDLFGTPQSGTVALNRISTFAAGGSYKFGPALLHGVYSLTDMKGGNSTAVLSTWEGGVTYWLTPAVSVLGGYAYSKLNETRWGQYMVSADYFLSKRTDLYALLNYEHVHGGDVQATLFTATPSSGGNQTIVSLGIRHRF
ncbi:MULTISPECIES: porin [unclassified Caballeronia]|uniref:porin n=1 Tax=unclassified Caballeronia TaxID=2646786 RepID=UPI003ECC4F39